MTAQQPPDPAAELCSLGRTLELVGQRWMFWILREAQAGTTRFADFRANLGIAPDVLADRLATLVEGGILVRRSYQEPGQRMREGYHLTDPGRQLGLVLGALQQWGDEHQPCTIGPTAVYRTSSGRPASVCFVDDQGVVLPQDDVHLERVTPAERD